MKRIGRISADNERDPGLSAQSVSSAPYLLCLASALVMLLLIGPRTPAYANQFTKSAVTEYTVAEYTVAEHHFDVRCTSPTTTLNLVSWRTSGEANVSSFKVHRTSLDEPIENRWVNRFPMVALGAGTDYRVIDNEAMPGRIYRYRLYGFEESGRLSLATAVILAERIQPSCSYMPMVTTTQTSPPP